MRRNLGKTRETRGLGLGLGLGAVMRQRKQNKKNPDHEPLFVRNGKGCIRIGLAACVGKASFNANIFFTAHHERKGSENDNTQSAERQATSHSVRLLLHSPPVGPLTSSYSSVVRSYAA